VKDAAAPDWLPDLIECDWNRFQETVERAHAIFLRDFGRQESRPSFRGKRMGLKRHPEIEGKSATFWHFVTEGAVEVSRTPDRARLERIAWPRAIIVEAGAAQSRVLVWQTERRRADHKKAVRWTIALPDFSYVVIVDDREEYVLPWTAYSVAEAHQRRKLEKDYNAWVASQKS